MRRFRATAVIALVAALVLAGCSDDEEPDGAEWPTPSTSASSSDGPTDEPTEAPTEPVLPDAAKKATEAGARAFVEYYFDLVNYAQVTGHVRPLRSVSNVNCERCNGIISLFTTTYRDGGHVTDGNYEVSIKSSEQLEAAADPYAFAVEVTVHNDEHQAVDRGGSIEVFPASDRDYTLFLLWVNDHWRLDVLEID